MIKNSLDIQGRVRLEVLCAHSGEVLECYESCNLVVTRGRTSIAQLLGSGDPSYRVTQIGFGEGTTTPAMGDTALTNVFSKGITSVSYPSLNSVRFAFQLDASEGNGLVLGELGLINDYGELFARYVWGGTIAKTNSLIVQGTWTIEI